MIVDDYLPVDASGNFIFASKPSSGALWGVLLEKAWAKVSGNYEFISQSQPFNALDFLSGAPSKSYYVADGATTWGIINDAFNLNYPVLALGNDTGAPAVGLIAGGFYTVVGSY